mmetsp:Transcript_60966/g.108472  ORF Transcript_60966/g.108472 Transcript_60966/m.108472 type:complete len:218 (+) Transcript_60966:885-1538(+)
MDVEERTQDVVYEKLHVAVTKWLLRADDRVEVCIHELSDDVHFAEVRARRRNHIQQLNDTVVLEKPQESDFSQAPLAVNRIPERVGDLFDRNVSLCLLVMKRCDMSVCAASKDFQKLQMARYFIGCAFDLHRIGRCSCSCASGLRLCSGRRRCRCICRLISPWGMYVHWGSTECMKAELCAADARGAAHAANASWAALHGPGSRHPPPESVWRRRCR